MLGHKPEVRRLSGQKCKLNGACWAKTQKEGGIVDQTQKVEGLLGSYPERRGLDGQNVRRNGAFWSEMQKEGCLLSS